MLLKEIFFYALFAITITATCAQHVNNHLQELPEKHSNKRLSKREVFVVDDLPGESVPHVSVRTKRFYKRMTKPRYRTPKQELLPNSYSKYKTKNFKTVSSPSSGKKRLPVTWRTPAKVKKNYNRKLRRPFKKPAKRLPRPVRKPSMTELPLPRPPHSSSIPHSSPGQEPMSFGEPPADYQPMNAPYQELPVDSYGAPIKTSVIMPNHDNHHFEVIDNVPDYTEWHGDTHVDNIMASNDYQPIARPSKFEKIKNMDDFPMNVASDYSDFMKHIPHTNLRKGLNKFRLQSNLMDEEDKVFVGGQYAEPPGRYISMKPKEKAIIEDSEPFSSNFGYMDIETTQSVSPYVNYKNSNMAFSPQNLNDAFSLDK